MKIYIPVLLILFLSGFEIIGQVKYEKESRIKEHLVPGSVPFDKKLKWYHEQALDRVSFEVKTTYQGNKYSIEFDDQGKIEDIEVKIKWKEVPLDVQGQMEIVWQTNHQKTKICKVQRQYLGDESRLLELLNATQVNGLKANYEIVINTKTGKNHEKYEYLFSAQGLFIKKSRIIVKNTDNLDY